ncbi:hypothetical protein BGZ57DRAFT_953915 [Hyaloscypha finlandica]|nr:hypothetical protein BGZ57DRAFT_953915 [Hyaloscypha finlandica]
MFLRSRDDVEVRRVSSFLFVVFYFIFVVLLILRLRAWDNYSSGQCYEPGFLHFIPDTRYVVVSAVLLIVAVIASMWPQEKWWTYAIVIVAAFQALVPLLSIASLRAAQQNFLVGGQSDDEFGYGQIMIMISLLAIAFEIFRCFRDYRRGPQPQDTE